MSRDPFSNASRRAVKPDLSSRRRPVRSLPVAPAQAEATAGESLEAVNLTCRRNGRLLFSELSFALGPGEAVLVDGPNGSGKTSLLRILCGLAEPDAGEVRWGGTWIRSAQSEFLDRIAYVAHAHGIKEELTPYENLRVAQAFGPAEPGGDAIDRALDHVGLSQLAHVPTRALSAGQKRLVALARLRVRRARLWVLDEPFTALDKRATGIVEAMLTAHTASGGLLVLTTHRVTRIDCARLARVRLAA